MATATACKFPPPPDVPDPIDAAAIDAPLAQYTVTVNVSGAGGGTVTVQPGDFTCSTGQCRRSYDAGTNLTVTATGTTSLDGFGGFTGDCSTSPCTIDNLGGAKTIDATFLQLQCAPNSQSCTAGLFTQCDAAGHFVAYTIPNGGANGSSSTITMNGYSCPMGCHASLPRCADVDASHGLNAALDDAGTSPSGMDLMLPRSSSVPAGTIVIDTNNFDNVGGLTTITDADDVAIPVPARVITQVGGPEILALEVRTFTIGAGFTVEVHGMRALAIVSDFDIYVAGTLDLSAVIPSGIRWAPGALSSGSCAGMFSVNGDGGGGGNRGDGGRSSGGAAGGIFQTPTVLSGGCVGGDLSGIGGGGAAQLVSRTKVVLAATALIDVSGAGGTVLAGSPGGGGSGGDVYLEAPAIAIAAGSVVAGRGGSGGADGASNSMYGLEGTTTGTSGAASVTCSGCGTSGAGGTETTIPGNATGTFPAQAGGGGSVGVCTTRNRAGAFTPPTGSMKIFHAVAGLAARSP